jgi:hypothetical protein
LIATSVWIERQVVAGVALLGADDAGRHRVLQAEGRTDRHDPFPHLQAADIADLHRRQAGGLDLHHRHVGAFVGPDDTGLELALVGQRHDDFISAVNHVRVRHDEAVGREDETRAHTARLLLGLGAAVARRLAREVRRHRQAEAAEELQHVLVHAVVVGRTRRRLLQRPDIDHRRPDLFDQFGEVRQAPGLGLGDADLQPGRGQQQGRAPDDDPALQCGRQGSGDRRHMNPRIVGR